MKMRVIVLGAMVLAWSIPACAATAQQTLAAFAAYEKVINCECVTRGNLEQALGGINKAVSEYAQTSRNNTPLGKKDDLLTHFQGSTMKLMVLTVQTTQGGDVDRARREVRETMQRLREAVGSR